MGEQLFLERFLWFDAEVRKNRFPNASTLAAARQFESSAKTAQRSIEFFRDRMSAPLEYDPVRKGFSAFPTRVGMNRLLIYPHSLICRVPHRRRGVD